MNRKTLIGLILIGAILLLWPTYLDVVFPEESPPVSPEKKLVVSSKEKETPFVSSSAEAQQCLGATQQSWSHTTCPESKIWSQKWPERVRGLRLRAHTRRGKSHTLN